MTTVKIFAAQMQRQLAANKEKVWNHALVTFFGEATDEKAKLCHTTVQRFLNHTVECLMCGDEQLAVVVCSFMHDEINFDWEITAVNNPYYTNVPVTVIKYQTADGKQHDNQKDAERHGKMLAGVVRICPDCKGTGMIDPTDDDLQRSCRSCNHTGYQEKTESWGPAA